MLIHEYIALRKLVNELQIDIEKLEYTKNHRAGTRARKKIQEIREQCVVLRNKIQTSRKINKLIRKQQKENKENKQNN